MKARLESGEVRALLGELCVKLGFCLLPIEIERIANHPPEDSDEFTEAVLVADCYGVASSDPVVDQARDIVAQAFMRHRAG